MDMSAAYIEAVSTHLPEAAIVFDHFHVIKLFNEELSDLRRELYREATDQTMKRQAHGFRDQELFKLRILAIHETKYALVG